MASPRNYCEFERSQADHTRSSWTLPVRVTIARGIGERIGLVRPVLLVVGLVLIATVLWDAFETVVLPRTVSRRLRLTRLYFLGTWKPWAGVARMVTSEPRRER